MRCYIAPLRIWNYNTLPVQMYMLSNAQIEKAHRMTYKQWLCFEKTDWKSLKWFYKKSFWFMASACFISSTRTKIDQGWLAQPGRVWADHAEIGGHPAAQWAKTSKFVQKPVSILNVREIRDFWWKKGQKVQYTYISNVAQPYISQFWTKFKGLAHCGPPSG